MARTRIKLAVCVDLDPVPGTFHTAESARNVVEALLNRAIASYIPTVVVESWDTRLSGEKN
jgi:hypothetical protein